MVLVAVLFPSCVVTVIVAVPGATPVTNPDAFTVAIPVLLEVHDTVLFAALAGDTVAVSCTVALTFRLADVGVTLTPVTATGVPGSVSYHVLLRYQPVLFRVRSAV